MNDLKYSHIISYVISTPWAILPSKLAVILDLLAFRAAGGVLAEDEIRQRIGAVSKPQLRQAGAIAVLPLFGTISYRANMMSEMSGGTSTERFTQSFRQMMNDPNVSAVAIDIDSPGGTVDGIVELADEIYQARSTKPVYAIANSMAASAAYWIGTAASEFSVIPSGEVGSIGVFAAHQDISGMLEKEGVKMSLISAGKHKTEGNPYEALSDEARAAIQERVDDYYGLFVDAIARNRGVSTKAIREGFGEGRVVGATRAKKLGMVDHIGTMDQLMSRIARQISKGGAKAEELTLFGLPVVYDDNNELAGLADITLGGPLIEADMRDYRAGISDTENKMTAEEWNDLDLRRRRLRLAGRR